MLRLRLLGPLELGLPDDSDGGDVVARPKRFALLAFLAVNAGTYQRRDSLLALLWPELDEFAARRALRQALHNLRRTLGIDPFQRRGDEEIMVDREAMWCDVVALADAVQASRHDEAIALYRGQLLEGFHVSNVGEGFESWLTRERARSLALVLRAFDAAVSAFERAGQLSEATAMARRALDLSPFDEPWLRRTVGLLEISGDRAGALRMADAFVERLATELEARPSADTRTLIDRLRLSNARGPVVPLPAGMPPRPTVTPNAEPDAARAAAQPVPDGSAAAAVLGPVSPATHRSMRVAVAVAAVLLVAAGGVIAWRARADHRPLAKQRVLVTRFENRTNDAAFDPLGDMEADWLTRGIVAAQFADAVDPRALLDRGRTRGSATANAQQLARRTGATLVIVGSYYKSADSLLFFARITDADGAVLRSIGPLPATVDQPVDGIEALRTRIMTLLASIVDPHSRSHFEFDEPPPTYEAYEPYIAGWDAFWLGQNLKAESLFAVASARDTSFDAASVSLATAASNQIDCRTVDSVAHSIAIRRRSLSDLDRLNEQIAVARCHGRNDEMFRLAMLRAQRLSPSSEWQLSTANAALWANRYGDARVILERIDPAVDLDWMPRNDHLDYWSSLTEVYHMMGLHDVEVSAAERSDLSGLAAALLRGRALAAEHRSAEALRLLDSSFTLPTDLSLSSGMAPNTDGRPQYNGSPAWVALWIARELYVHGDSTAGRTAAIRSGAWIGALPREDRDAAEMRMFSAEFLEQAGAYAAAKRVVQELLATDTSNVDYHGMLAGLAAETGDTALAQRQDAWLASLPPDRGRWGASFYRARLAALENHQPEAVALVRETMARGAWPYWLHLDPALHRLTGRADYTALTRPRF